MYCPVCGQQQISENTRFCSRCGFLLTNVSEIISHNGGSNNQINQLEEVKDSPRKRGLKQGLMFLLVGTLLILPLVTIISIAIHTGPFMSALVTILSLCGGILRMIYALMFESKFPAGNTLEQNMIATVQNLTGKNLNQSALPSAQSIPVSDFVYPPKGNWRDTNDLVEPHSVTDPTTKLLEEDK